MEDFVKRLLEEEKELRTRCKKLEKFIDTDNKLKIALMNQDWHMVATIYNGSGYKDIALKYGRVPYDEAMEKAYQQFKNK